MKRARCAWLALVFLWAGAIFALPRDPAHASSSWSKPVQLFNTDGYTNYPLLVADSAGDVHLIFMSLNQRNRDVTVKTNGSLMYARMQKGIWSTPSDVLVTPGGGTVNLPAMTLSADGYLHVVWQGGFSSQIYYSRAHVTEAGVAQGWTKADVLSDGAASGSSIFAAADGRLHFVYAGTDGNIRYRHSDDGGHVWSPPLTLVDTEGRGSAADFPRVMSDQNGQVYLTWNQYQLPNGWPPVGAFSANSLDAGDSWLPPVRVAPQNYGFIAVQPTSGNTVYRVWNSTVALGERRYQISRDAGKTWNSSRSIPSLAGGFSGPPSLALDSVGTLHLLTAANLRQAQSAGGIYEVALTNGAAWSDPVYVSEGVLGQTSIEEPSIAIANGSRLVAVWEEDFNRIWYSERLLGTPQDPPRPVPGQVRNPARTISPGSLLPDTPSVATVGQPSVGGQASPTATPRTKTPLAAQPTSDLSTPVLPVMAIFVSSLLLLVAAVLYTVIRRRGV